MAKSEDELATDGGTTVSTLDAGFPDRLREALKRVRETEWPDLGRSRKTLSRYLSGKEPPVGVLIQVAKASGVHINWLATGEGPRDSASGVRQIEGTQPEQTGLGMLQIVDPSALEASGLVMVPLLDIQAAAGSGRAPTDGKTLALMAFAESLLREAGVNPRFAHVIQVSGLSMYPTLNHEDLVLIDTSIDHVRDEALYAVTYGDNILVKRVRLGLDGSVTLSSDNKSEGHSDLIVKPADLPDLHIAGRVCGRVTLRM